MTEKYIFKLREDMPRGFKNNENIPELPAVYGFLQQYDGKFFSSKEEFGEKLGGFADYLHQNKVPLGWDSQEIREGIFIFENGAVGVNCSGPEERCEYGRLEREVLD